MPFKPSHLEIGGPQTTLKYQFYKCCPIIPLPRHYKSKKGICTIWQGSINIGRCEEHSRPKQSVSNTLVYRAIKELGLNKNRA